MLAPNNTDYPESNTRKERIVTINSFWGNFLWCNNEDFAWNTIKIITHSRELLESNEIYILMYTNGRTIISVPQEAKEEVEWIIRVHGLDNDRLYPTIERLYDGERKTTWIIITSYLFSRDSLMPRSPMVRPLNKDEASLYEDFMEKCSTEDKSEVFMIFEEEFHEFYGYFEDGKMLAICNYVRSGTDDKIAHIWLLVRWDQKWKWYGKILANAVSHEILDKGLIPQYRADSKNTASIKIATSLWYEEILRWYSLRIR